MNGLFDTPKDLVDEFAQKWDEHNGIADFEKLFQNPANVQRALEVLQRRNLLNFDKLLENRDTLQQVLATRAVESSIKPTTTISAQLSQLTGNVQQFRPMMTAASSTNTMPKLPLPEYTKTVPFTDSLIGALYGLAYGSAVGMPFAIWQNDIAYRDKRLYGNPTSDIPPIMTQLSSKTGLRNLTAGLPGYPFEHCMLVFRHAIGMRAYSRDTIIGDFITWTNGLNGAWMKPDPFMKLFKGEQIDKFSNTMNWYLNMNTTSPDNGEYLCRVLPLCYCEAGLIDDITLTNPCDIAIEVGKMFAYLYRGLLSATPFETVLAEMQQIPSSADIGKVFADLSAVKSIDEDIQAFSRRRVPEKQEMKATQCLYIVLAALKRYSLSPAKPERMLDAIRWSIFDANGLASNGFPPGAPQLIGGLVAGVCGMILGIEVMKSSEPINVNLQRLQAAAKIDIDPNYLSSLVPRPAIGNTPRREISVLDIFTIVSSFCSNCDGMKAQEYSRTLFKPKSDTAQEQFIPSSSSGYSGAYVPQATAYVPQATATYVPQATATYVPQATASYAPQATAAYVPQSGMSIPGLIASENMGNIEPVWMDRPVPTQSGMRQL